MTERLPLLSTPPKTAPEPSQEALEHPERALNVMDLYKAAIGSRQQAYYLKQFARQEAQPGFRLGWHWPAFVSALNWLVFRRMWDWAGRYAVLLCVLALGVGVGAHLFELTRMQTLALALGVWLGLSVLSALVANGVYYRHCMGLIHRVLLDGSNREGAADLLAQQACSDRRWNGQALVNVAVLLLLPALAHFAPWSAGDFLAWLHETPAGESVQAQDQLAAADPERRVLPAGSGTRTLKITVPDTGHPPEGKAAAKTAPKPTPNPVPEDVTDPKPEAKPLVAIAPAPAAAPQKAEAASPAVAAVTESTVAKPLAPSSAVVHAPVSEAKASALAGLVLPGPPAPAPVAVATAAATASTKATTQAARAAVPAAAPSPAPTAVAQAKAKAPVKQVPPSAPTGAVAAGGAFGVQVGIFAQPANVANVVSKLKARGLPVYTDPITMSGEARTRVRVGPYTRSGEAERVAGQIAGLGLPAVVVPLRSAARPAPSR